MKPNEKGANMKYRHELKHQINLMDMLMLRQRLSAIAKKDEHTIDGKYFIRSLYFDTSSDKALREKIDGINKREKFRLRIYNNDTSVILLEKKSKINGLCLKDRVELTREQAQAIVDGEISWMKDSNIPLVRELYCKITGQGLKPRTIVDYTREPFIFEAGNVRVTLDYNIKTGLNSTDFFNPACVTIPTGEDIILEVKWDEYLPDIIRDIVQLPACRSGAFSKYAVCRIYG